MLSESTYERRKFPPETKTGMFSRTMATDRALICDTWRHCMVMFHYDLEQSALADGSNQLIREDAAVHVAMKLCGRIKRHNLKEYRGRLNRIRINSFEDPEFGRMRVVYLPKSAGMEPRPDRPWWQLW